jgi:hypothetical protein
MPTMLRTIGERLLRNMNKALCSRGRKSAEMMLTCARIQSAHQFATTDVTLISHSDFFNGTLCPPYSDMNPFMADA